MVMGVEPLVTASVGDIPDSERLVIRGREEILAPRVPGDACSGEVSVRTPRYCQ